MVLTKKCGYCSKIFPKKKWGCDFQWQKRKYCSPSCARKSRSKGFYIICKFCGKKCARKPSHPTTFCSMKCYSDYRDAIVTKECNYCQKKFTSCKSQKRISCSKECAYKSMEKTHNKKCKWCSKSFVTKNKKIVFCSHKCVADSLRGKMVEFSCDFCGKLVKEKEGQYNLSKNHFCSRKCHNNWRDEFGKKKTYVCEICGEKFDSYFTKQKFCSHKCFYKYRDKNPRLFSGENSSNWKGGKSFEPYNSDFNEKLKNKIRKRDNYRCQQCFRHQDELFKNTKAGIRRYKLSVHHIDYDKKNNRPENLISLCVVCHAQTGFGREDWTTYFQEKVGV